MIDTPIHELTLVTILQLGALGSLVLVLVVILTPDFTIYFISTHCEPQWCGYVEQQILVLPNWWPAVIQKNSRY
jgi:hypothetical protein